MNIVIMAGGGGTRLWPLSRERFPKQFTQLVGKRTLLQSSFDRALSVVRNPAKVVITTRGAYVNEIRRQLPRMPARNILAEPVKRDSAPSVGMAAAYLAARGSHDEPLLMLPSDPYIRNEDLFRRSLRRAGKLLLEREGITVLLGNTPTYPETGYGYVEKGGLVAKAQGTSLHAVKRFREKPRLPQAKRYVASGKFLWNMGVYGWRVSTLLRLLHAFAPDIARRLDRLEGLFRAGAGPRRIAAVYRTMPSVSVDFAVTERQDPRSIFVLGGHYGWSDVGHWGALQEILGGKEGLELKRGAAAYIHSGGNFVYSTADVAIGLAGVHNLIIVSTPDALLVCDKRHVQDVKKLVEEFQRHGHKKFL